MANPNNVDLQQRLAESERVRRQLAEIARRATCGPECPEEWCVNANAALAASDALDGETG